MTWKEGKEKLEHRGQRRSSVCASACPRGDGDASVWRRPGGDLRQSVRILWSEEDSTQSGVVLQKVVGMDIMTMTPKAHMELIRHDFLGEHRPSLPFLPRLMDHRIEAHR